MKRILSLLSIFLFILSFSQKAEINAKILFADGTASNAKILFRKSIFYENEIYENSITKRIFFSSMMLTGKKNTSLINSNALNLLI